MARIYNSTHSFSTFTLAALDGLLTFIISRIQQALSPVSCTFTLVNNWSVTSYSLLKLGKRTNRRSKMLHNIFALLIMASANERTKFKRQNDRTKARQAATATNQFVADTRNERYGNISKRQLTQSNYISPKFVNINNNNK